MADYFKTANGQGKLVRDYIAVAALDSHDPEKIRATAFDARDTARILRDAASSLSGRDRIEMADRASDLEAAANQILWQLDHDLPVHL